MKRAGMYLNLIIFACLAPLGAMAQDVLIVPHIPADRANFSVSIVIDNLIDRARKLTINAHAPDGTRLEVVVIDPAPLARLNVPLDDLLADKATSHLVLTTGLRENGRYDSFTGIQAGVHIARTSDPEGGTFVAAVSVPARHWRIDPGDWRKSFDGIAMIDIHGCSSDDILLIHRRADGQELKRHEFPAIGRLYGKQLISLGAIFDPVPESYVELISGEYLAVVGLRGSLSGMPAEAYLIDNQISARPEFEPDRYQLEEQRFLWNEAGITSYRFTYQNHCFCSAEVTRPAVVLVENDTIISITDAQNGEAIPSDLWANYDTVAGLLERIQTYQDALYHEIEVNYDGALGIPQDIFLDPNFCHVDDEKYITTSDFRSIK